MSFVGLTENDAVFSCEKATCRPVLALLFQRDIVLHNADNVRLAAQVIDEGLWKAHGSFMNQRPNNVKSSAL